MSGIRGLIPLTADSWKDARVWFSTEYPILGYSTLTYTLGTVNMRGIHSPEYRDFLGKLRKARKDAGLTQGEVAKRLRRPQSYVSKCESGERRVDVTELAEFARLYEKPLEFFAATDS
jgi:DNA-binding XRE family transcriptional regulator